MAFGVKVKLDVELANASKLRSQIQQAIENATQNKPVKIRHLAVDLGRQEAQRISKQLESAIASQDLTIKIAKIDASRPVADLKKQLTTMLSGLSITGLKDFLGADGVGDSYDKAATAANRLAEAQENVRRKTEEANAAMKTLKSVQSTLNTVFKSTTLVGDQAKLEAYLNTYRELIAASEAAKNKTGEEQSAEVMRITAATIALKKEVDAQLQAEQAAKKKAAAAKSAEEIAKKTAAEQERAAKRESDLLTQTIQLRKRMASWKDANPKAYAEYKTQFDAIFSTIGNGSAESRAALAEVRAQFEQIDEAARSSGLSGKSFFDVLKAGWAKFGGWSIVTKSMMAAVRAFKDMVNTVIELNTAMTELRKVTNLTSSEYEIFEKTASAAARRVGASISDTINATADFARLGYDINDASQLAEAALIYKNVGDGIDDIGTATESLISTIKAFGIEASNAMSIVDMFNEVGNNFAISSSGIGEALQRSASSLAAAGNTIQESIGLITAMNSVVQNPEQVGTAIKTLTMYLRAAKTEAEEAGIETDGMASSVSQLREQLLDLSGVDIMIDDSTFKSTYQIMKELANVWNSLKDVQQANILNLIGGKRNSNVVSSLLKNFKDAEDAMNAAMKSTGSAMKENEKFLDSIKGKINALTVAIEELASAYIDDKLIGGVIDSLRVAVDVLGLIVKTLGTFPATIGAATIAMNAFGHSFGFLDEQKIASLISAFAGNRTASGAKDFISGFGNLFRTSASGLFTNLKNYASTFFSNVNGDKSALVSFNKELENGTEWVSAFKKHMLGASNEAQGMAIQIGKGEATLNSFGISSSAVTLKLKTMSIAAKMANIALQTLANIAVSFAISAVINGISKIISYIGETRRAADEAAKAAQQAAIETTKTVSEEISKYLGLVDALNEGTIAQDEFKSSAIEIIEALGIQGETIDSLIEKYGDLNNAMLSISLNKLRDSQYSLQGLVNDARNDLLGAYSNFFSGPIGIFNSYNQAASKLDLAIQDALEKNGYEIQKSYLSARGYTAQTAASINFKHGDSNTIDGIRKSYEELTNVLEILYSITGAKESDFFQRVLAEQTRIKKLIDAYDTAVQNLNENIGGQFILEELINTGLPKTIQEFESFRKSVIDAAVASGQFSGEGEALSDTVSGVVDSLLAMQSWAVPFINAMMGGSGATDAMSKSLNKFTDALSKLKNGYDVLTTAQQEQNSTGGLSPETISSIASMLEEEEKISDYLIYENGVIKLNELAWKNRSESMFSEDISTLKQQIAYLQAANSAIRESGDLSATDEKTIADNEIKIAQLEKELDLYKSIYGEVTNPTDDPTNLTSMISELDNIGNKSKGLISVLDSLNEGTSMSAGEVANLALQYEELFGMSPDYDLTTLEGQKAAIEAIISAYESEFDAIIDTQIASLEAAKTREGITEAEVAGIDAKIERLTTLKGLELGDIFGDAKETETQTKKFSELSDAIDGVSKATKLLTDIQSGEGDTLSMLQSIIGILQDAEGLNLEDFITGFEDGEITWNEQAIRNWSDALVEAIPGIDELDAKFPGIKQHLMDLAQAEVEAANETEALKEAFSNVGKAMNFLSDIQSSDNDPLDMIQSAIELAELVEGTDWTSWIKSFDASTGAITWDDEALKSFTSSIVNAIPNLEELEAKFPGITQYLKENAFAAEEAKLSYDALSTALSGVGKAAGLLTDIQSGSTDVLSMLSTIVDMAEESGQNISDFFSIVNGEFVWNEQAIKGWSDALVDKIRGLPGVTEETITAIKALAQAEIEAATASDLLSQAISGVQTASSLLTDIQSGEGDTLSMLQTVADMAQQSGQSLNDFFTITGNEIKWDEGAIVDWAGNLVDRLSEIKEISPEVQAYLKGMIAAEIEAATAAERMQKAYSNMQSAAQSRSSFGGYTQITYEDYQSLIETDKRYASAIEYQNGVMVLNSAKHDEITMKILEENKAMALAEKQAILMSEEYQELRRKMDAGILTENEDRQRLLDLETQITGYDVLANEIDNATSAYYRWLNRKGDDGMDRYSQALKAFGLIDSTLNDKESEYYGRIGRDEFGAAIDFVIGENVEVNTPEFDRAMNLCKRYLTDGAEGAANFYDDMVSAGLLDATTGSLNSTVAEIANALGVSEEMVRTMIDRINEYQEEANKIDVTEPEVSVDTESTESALDRVITSLESANEYISTISNTPLAISIQDEEKTTTGLTSFKDLLNAIQTNLLTILQNPLSFNISDLAIAVQSIIEHIPNIQKAIETANGLALNIDGSSSEASLDSLNDSANIVVTSLTAISNILTAIVASRDSINSTGINITTGSSSTLLGSVSSKLSAIISQLAKIKANSNITVRINEITTKTTRTGGLFSGLLGNSSVSGNAAVRGTAMASGGNTLVGELGMETVVDPATNTWYTVGERGAEFIKLPKDAIVFNHIQTEKLFGIGRIDSRGEARISGNMPMMKPITASSPSTSLSGSLISSVISGAVSLIKNATTGITTAANAVSDIVSGSGTKKIASSEESAGGNGSGAQNDANNLEELKDKYEELNKQTEHLIAHQEFLYKQAEKGLDYSGMDKSLQAQAELYKKIMSDSQEAVAEMIASGADDTSEELQSMEEAYWSAYESLYNTLDKINDLYVDALNEKIDGIQTAFDNLQTAADEFNKYGGITLDSFQALLENGVQYMSLLENQDGQYVINTEGIQKLIAAQKEQLAVESAISYLKQLQTALADGESNAVANLVNLTNQLSSTTWDAVYAQAALLRANLSDEQYAKVIANIDALRAISSAVITDISKQLDDSDTDRTKNIDDQQNALDEILKLTEDLIEAEAKDRIEAIEDEIDAYKKIIDLKKESLKASKDENDYAKSVAEKTKEIAKLQVQIDQLKLDDSREARAERASLEEQLANLQGELGDLQSDRAYEIQTDALDKAAEDFEDARQKEIDAIESSISSAEKLYQAAMARLESGWDTLYQELIDWNTETGSSLNSEITENWLKAAEAVKLYGSYVQAVAGVKAAQEAAENTTTSSSTVVATGTPTVIPPREEIPAQIPSVPETDSNPEPEPEPVKKVKVISGRWNVRTGPSTNNKILGVVGEGTILDYRGQTSGNWYAVTYNGNDAWINNGGSKIIEELPKYHIGGIAGGNATAKDNEVLSVLEEGEMILTEKMKKAAYKLIDFKDYLEEKLGHAIGTVTPPIPQVPALAGVGISERTGIDVGQVNFNPTVHVEINHSGAMTDKDARQFGKTIADTATNELYEGFRKRGIGKLFGTKPTQ